MFVVHVRIVRRIAAIDKHRPRQKHDQGDFPRSIAEAILQLLMEADVEGLTGTVLEQNDEWKTSSRYMLIEAFAQIEAEKLDPILSITTRAA